MGREEVWYGEEHQGKPKANLWKLKIKFSFFDNSFESKKISAQRWGFFQS